MHPFNTHNALLSCTQAELQLSSASITSYLVAQPCPINAPFSVLTAGCNVSKRMLFSTHLGCEEAMVTTGIPHRVDHGSLQVCVLCRMATPG